MYTRIHKQDYNIRNKKKAIAISVMTSLMANQKYSIMEAAGLAAQICGYSEHVRKQAFALFTSMAAHSNLDDIDEFVLSSDQG